MLTYLKLSIIVIMHFRCSSTTSSIGLRGRILGFEPLQVLVVFATIEGMMLGDDDLNLR